MEGCRAFAEFERGMIRERVNAGLWRLKLRSDLSSSFGSGGWLYKAIETTQSLVLLFQEFAVGNPLCNWRLWFLVWRYNAIIAIEPLLRSVFDREATSQLIEFCLGVRVRWEKSAENCNAQPRPMIVHGFSRFAFSPISTPLVRLPWMSRQIARHPYKPTLCQIIGSY
jgi:hypothetical protein